VSITLQKVQATFILKYTIIASKGFSRLVTTSSSTSLSISNMIFVIGGGFGT
jgi:hypothetical protein